MSENIEQCITVYLRFTVYNDISFKFDKVKHQILHYSVKVTCFCLKNATTNQCRPE